jgi:hypothetical protein
MQTTTTQVHYQQPVMVQQPMQPQTTVVVVGAGYALLSPKIFSPAATRFPRIELGRFRFRCRLPCFGSGIVADRFFPHQMPSLQPWSYARELYMPWYVLVDCFLFFRHSSRRRGVSLG